MTKMKEASIGDWLIPNATVFVASACVMIIELVAGRIVSQHLGQSLYTWTTIIGVVLAGISIGNYIGGRLADRFDPGRTLSLMFILSSVFALTVPGMNHLMGEWRWMWEQSWPVRIVIHILLTFIVPSTVLGTISPLVAKMALTKSTHTGRTIGDVYAMGAAGSIVGTFLAGFYLVAALGTIAIMLVVSAVLAVLGVLYGLRRFSPYAWAVVCAGALTAALANSPTAEAVGARLGLRETLDSSVVYFNESQYSRILVKETSPGVRAMYLDKLMHSKVDLRDPMDLQYSYTWVYTAVTDTVAPAGRPIRAMVIGGGGYAYPYYLERTRPGSYLEVAEIDPAVTEAAFEAFGLPRDTTLRIFNMDARNHVKDLLKRRRAGEDIPAFDFVYGDSINDYSVPYHLTTKEFTEEIRELLADDGMYLLNLIDMQDVGLFLGSIIATCEQTFPYIYVFSCSQNTNVRDTFIVVCSKKPRDVTAIQGRLKADFPYHGRLLTSNEMQDLSSRGVVLTDEYAPVENQLAAMLKRDSGEALRQYMLAGETAARKGRFDRAIADFSSALKINPNDPAILYNLGVAYRQAGQMRSGIEMFTRALALNPSYGPALISLGLAHAESGNMREAIDFWLAASKTNSGNPAVHNNLGNAYAALGEYEAAADHWREAIRLQPYHAGARSNLANLLSLPGPTTGGSHPVPEGTGDQS